MDVSLTLTGGGLVSLVIEGFKFIWRKFVTKNMEYDFPVMFYAISVPVLNALAPFALVAIGVPTTDPILGMGWPAILQYILQILIGSLISVVVYGNAIKPTRAYVTEMADSKAEKVAFTARMDAVVAQIESKEMEDRQFNHNP